MPAAENYIPPPGLNLKWLAGRLRAGIHTTLLIACNSNYIRSPYSEYILRRAFATLPTNKASLLRVTSGATVFDRKVDGIHPHVRDYMLQQERFTPEELNAHDPKYLKRPEHRHLMEEADVILAFEKTQLRTIPTIYRSKARLISQFVREEEIQILDPLAEATPEEIAMTFAAIRPYLDAIIEAIKNV